MWKNSLKTKLVVSFTLISFVAVTVAGASALTGMRKTIEQEIQNKLQLLADAKEGQIFAYLDSLESRTIDFSSDGFIRDSLKEITNTHSTIAANALTEHLINNKKPLDENLFCIMILDLNGKVVSSVTKEEIGNDESSSEQFVEGKKRVFIGKEIGAAESESGKTILSVGAPIVDNNTGKLLGVIVNSFTTDKISKILSGEFQVEKGAASSSLGQSSTLEIHLVNKEKKVLAHGHKETGQMVDTIGALPVQECLNNQKEITGIYTNYHGVEVIGASMCFPQRDWTLLTEISTAEAFAPVRNTTYGLVIMLVLILMFIILDIFLIADNLIKPIKKLHEATDIVAQGNLDYKVDIKTGDEIQQLGEAFNTMAASIQKSHAELQQFSKGLEEKVTEKTKELTDKVSSLEDARSAMTNVMEDFEKEKNKTTAILTNMGDGMIATDKERRIIYMSLSAEEMLGWRVKDAIGKHISDWVAIEDERGDLIASEKRPIHLALSTGKKIKTTTTSVYWFAPKNKDKFPAAVTASPIFSGEKIIGAILIFRDITHEREVDRMKTEFISLSSHQLRTPLSAMKWFLEMLLNGDAGALSREQKEYLDNINQSNERMIALVNALLNVSRIESGRIIIDPKPTDLGVLVKETLTELDNKIKAKNLSLIISVHPDLTKINIDPNLIREVYKNFLTNSIKYTPKNGEISIFISKKDDEIISQISDNGVGIPAAEQRRVFEKLYRGTNIVKMETDGTGLGLYLAKAIVESSGGKVWFKSEDGHGTSFWFSLPAAGNQPKAGEVTIGS